MKIGNRIHCDVCRKSLHPDTIVGDFYYDPSDDFAVHFRCYFELHRLAIKKSVAEFREKRDGAYWKLHDGRLIPISQMDNSHLLNAISYLRTRAAAKFLAGGGVGDYLQKTKYPLLISEAQRRGLIVPDAPNPLSVRANLQGGENKSADDDDERKLL